MVKILRPKLDAVCGSGVVVEIYLVAPVLNARTIVGRIFVSKVCIVGEAGRRVVGISIGIEVILVESNRGVAEQLVVEYKVPTGGKNGNSFIS